MINVMSDKKAITVFMAPALLFFLLIIAAPVAMSLYYRHRQRDVCVIRQFQGTVCREP